MPKGNFLRATSRMFLNCTKMDWAVSGRRYATAASSSSKRGASLGTIVAVPAVIVQTLCRDSTGGGGAAGPVAPAAETGKIAGPDHRASTGPTRVLNMRLNGRASDKIG